MDKFLLAIFSAFLLFHCSFIVFVHGATITTPCSQTPYPDVCNHFRIDANLVQSNRIQTPFAFRDQSLLVTMNQAIQAHQSISNMDLSPFDQKGKLAWADCLELYADTVDQLSRSLSSSNPIDAQTWLSAATANQQTCENGFIDFNLASNLESLPYMLGNFSKLLSNSLAINKVTISSQSPIYDNFYTRQGSGHRRLLVNGFPSWVSSGDRRLLQSTAPLTGDIVVAQDGSGNYKSISEALAASVKQRSGVKRFVIYVKKGVYNENINIERSMKNLMFIGDGIDATIVTGNKNIQDDATTFRSATFAVSGDRFIARDMTFENTAGPQKNQAVALRSGSDFSVFYRCSFKGYQDTLYVYALRQFYRDCDVYGTVDFICGDAAVVLQNCNIYIRRSVSGQTNTVTAQGRKDPNENTGIVFHNSRVAAADDLGSSKSYLGRPWHEYSRTVFMKSTLDGIIDPAGWLPWQGTFALRTLYYAEYMNTGAGAATGRRVNWPGYHVLNSPAEAGKFTVGNFLAGDSWIPGTGVPFDTGL
uniref:Pectinesterase n=2 Tax=Rhizophora mucronata TaxID=61149 RepID=A0A2P2JQR9_RHIMU